MLCFRLVRRPNNFTSLALAITVNDLRKAGIAVTVFDARQMKLDFPGSAPTPDAVAMTQVRGKERAFTGIMIYPSILVQAISAAAGVIIATPEYHVRNSSSFGRGVPRYYYHIHGS